MTNSKINLFQLIIILLSGVLLWFIPTPSGLEDKAWHIFVIFLMTIVGIITNVMPMGAVALASITALSLTKTLSLQEALSGFSSNIAWLIVIAFFIARGFIQTNLGQRIAYMLISAFGKSSTGLSYSLIFTEFLLAPLIPSTSARGGGIIYPIATSLAREYDQMSGHKSKTSSFLIMTCFHTNVVCCALFLTSMAGNSLIKSLAGNIGVNISWGNWALATIVPGLINLFLLPYIVSLTIKPDIKSNQQIVDIAKQSLKAQGNLKRNEIVMLIVLALMLFLWIFGSFIKLDATSAALIGFCILIISGVINWESILEEKAAWETFIWFSTLLMLSDYLAKMGIDLWLKNNITAVIAPFSAGTAILLLGLFYFYCHYFFASITGRITVMYSIFLLILIELGAPPLISALGLAILSNLSAGLTHYGINTAPIYFKAGYFTASQWFKAGIIISTTNLLLWVIFGSVWWKVLGWW
jgi:DASS family divalent anion:Na+ symporter